MMKSILKNLRDVCERLREHGIHVNYSKCKFRLMSVEYMLSVQKGFKLLLVKYRQFLMHRFPRI